MISAVARIFRRDMAEYDTASELSPFPFQRRLQKLPLFFRKISSRSIQCDKQGVAVTEKIVILTEVRLIGVLTVGSVPIPVARHSVKRQGNTFAKLFDNMQEVGMCSPAHHISQAENEFRIAPGNFLPDLLYGIDTVGKITENSNGESRPLRMQKPAGRRQQGRKIAGQSEKHGTLNTQYPAPREQQQSNAPEMPFRNDVFFSVSVDGRLFSCHLSAFPDLI